MSAYLTAFHSSGLIWEQIKGMADSELIAVLEPKKSGGSTQRGRQPL
jgi:hypothetical protein